MRTFSRPGYHRIVPVFMYLIANTAFAAMYKWVDEDGQTHYTGRPPVEDVEIKVIKPPSRVNTEGALDELEGKKEKLKGLQENRAKRAEEQADADKQASTEKANCGLARDKLARVSTNPRVYSGEGENRRRLGEEERQARIAAAKKDITKYCK